MLIRFGTIFPAVLIISELLCCQCTCTYVPNCSLQCLLYSTFE